MNTDQLYGRFPRALTFDEKRAAEAAFSGKPPCATWSQSAQRIYEGLIEALATRSYECLATDPHDRQPLPFWASARYWRSSC